MADARPTPTRLSVTCPPEEEGGRYADMVSVWHNASTFVLDFVAMTKPARPGTDAEGRPVLAVDGRVVSRVRIPQSQVFELMKALEHQLSAWERETGSATGPPSSAS